MSTSKATGDLELPSLTPVEAFLDASCAHLETTRTRKSGENDVSYLRTVFGPVCDALKPKSTLNQRPKARKRIRVKDRLAKRHVKVGTLEELSPSEIDAPIARQETCRTGL